VQLDADVWSQKVWGSVLMGTFSHALPSLLHLVHPVQLALQQTESRHLPDAHWRSRSQVAPCPSGDTQWFVVKVSQYQPVSHPSSAEQVVAQVVPLAHPV
jgi:hypothetical protein